MYLTIMTLVWWSWAGDNWSKQGILSHSHCNCMTKSSDSVMIFFEVSVGELFVLGEDLDL